MFSLIINLTLIFSSLLHNRRIKSKHIFPENLDLALAVDTLTVHLNTNLQKLIAYLTAIQIVISRDNTFKLFFLK